MVDPLAQLITDPVLYRFLLTMPALDFYALRRPPYIALIGAILGQKIRYTAAKKLRSQFYSLVNDLFAATAQAVPTVGRENPSLLSAATAQAVPTVGRENPSLLSTDPSVAQMDLILPQLQGVPDFMITILQQLQAFLRWRTTQTGNTFSFAYNLDELQQVPGIGEWTLNTVRLVAMDHILDRGPTGWMAIYPVGDVFLLKRVKKLYGSNVNLPHLLYQWGPYAGIITWYLWRWFDDHVAVAPQNSAIAHLLPR